MRCWVLAAAIGRVVEQHRRRVRSGEGAVVANIGPQPAGGGLALREDRHRRIVAVQPAGGQHVMTDQGVKGSQSGCRGPDLVGQGRDVEGDTLAGIALALPVQRLVAAVLLEQHHRQQPGAEPPARDDVEGRGWLRDRLAVPAGELLAHGLAHEPAARDDVEGLGDDLTDLGQAAATAAATGRGRRDDNPLARQVLGQRPAGRPAAQMGRDRIGSGRGILLRLVLGEALLEFGELELELVDQTLPTLAGLAEALAASLRQQQPEALDLERRGSNQSLGAAPRLALGDDQGVRRGEVVRKRCWVVRHATYSSTTWVYLEDTWTHQVMRRLSSACDLRPPSPLRHPPVDPFQQIPELCCRDRHDSIRRRGPDKAAPFETLRKQAHALAVVPEHLDQGAAATAGRRRRND